MKKRNCGYDNLRAVLIFCVVAGHLLELVGGTAATPLRKALYFLIYSFHIPALIFLNGYFAKFSWGRTLGFLGMYVIFQTVYLLYGRFALGSTAQLQFHTPYWLLWYLVSLFAYQFLIPLLKRVPQKSVAVVITASVLTALAAGYSGEIGYKYSLSRTLAFLPFFVIGFYTGQRKDELAQALRKEPGCWCWFGAGALVMTVLLYLSGITKNMLYGSYAYSVGYGPVTRFFIMATAMLWIMAFLDLFLSKLNRSLPFLTSIGRNTLPVYLLHGFVVRIMGKYNWDGDSFLVAALVTVLLTVGLGNPWVGRLFSGPWKRQNPAGNSR